jgi:hypothetical protein
LDLVFEKHPYPTFRSPRQISLSRRTIDCEPNPKACVMFATLDRSTIMLINPQRAAGMNLSDRFKKRIEKNHALLRDAVRVSGVSMRLLGDVDNATNPFASLPNCQVLSGDAVNFWRDEEVTDRLGPPEIQVVYVGGAWLEEHILVAALSAVRIGYDTRVLLDVSVARSLFDRTSALERLTQHGVLMTTVRQTVIEWSLSALDHNIGQQLREILPQ